MNKVIVYETKNGWAMFANAWMIMLPRYVKTHNQVELYVKTQYSSKISVVFQ
jgi:hypothetical protein